MAPNPCRRELAMMSKFDYDSYSGDYQYRAIETGHPVQSFWHRKRLDAALSDVETQPGYRLLDVGCGAGVFTFGFASRIRHAIGVDISRRPIEFCNTHKKETGKVNCDFVLIQPGESFPFKTVSMDVVLLTEVIEHLSPGASYQVLHEIRRVLRPYGTLYLTTPNDHSLWPLVEKILDASGQAPPLEGEQHLQKFTPRLLVNHLERMGFRVKQIDTFFVISPFVAPISSRIANALFAIEKRLAILPGMVLAALCTK